MDRFLALYERTKPARFFLVCGFLSLAACSSPKNAGSIPQVADNGSMHRSAAQTTRYLFVANFGDHLNDVSMYALQSNKLIHSVSAGVETQYSLLDDASSRLYVMDRNGKRITVYGPKKRYVSYVISQSSWSPVAMILDTSGALYVANYYGGRSGGSVEVFAPGSKTLARTITDGVANPVALAFDRSGNLFVANSYLDGPSVTVYAPGGGNVKHTITDGIQVPVALATDAGGNLYVINLLQDGSGNVKVYNAGSYTLALTITSGLSRPDSLAFDSFGNLYVGNATNITVYAPGSSKVMRTIPTQHGGFATRAMIFDDSGVLYAGYQGIDSGGVNLYAPGSNTPMLMIRRHQGVAQPFALAIGP